MFGYWTFIGLITCLLSFWLGFRGVYLVSSLVVGSLWGYEQAVPGNLGKSGVWMLLVGLGVWFFYWSFGMGWVPSSFGGKLFCTELFVMWLCVVSSGVLVVECLYGFLVWCVLISGVFAVWNCWPEGSVAEPLLPLSGRSLVKCSFLLSLGKWVTLLVWGLLSLDYEVGSAALVGVSFSLGLLLSGFKLARWQVVDVAKGSPYECGFDPVGQAWNPVPMRFFHLVLLFVLWEAETLLLIPYMLCIWDKGYWQESAGVFVFCFILFWGLVYEWSEGSLAWASA